eukprot:4466461-Amphidinium_carterae.3
MGSHVLHVDSPACATLSRYASLLLTSTGFERSIQCCILNKGRYRAQDGHSKHVQGPVSSNLHTGVQLRRPTV